MLRSCLLLVVLAALFTHYSALTSKPSNPKPSLFLGLDCGTSGIRATVITQDDAVVAEASLLWSQLASENGSLPALWSAGLYKVISDIPKDCREGLKRICISGTSSTCMLLDCTGGEHRASRQPRMYDYNILLNDENSDIGSAVMKAIKGVSPTDSVVNNPTSTLPKLLSWHRQHALSQKEQLVHQADYLVALLADRSPTQLTTDWHNALKLGYDVNTLSYPKWLFELLKAEGISNAEKLLPAVLEPGREVGSVSPAIRTKFGIPADCTIVAGTTDSIAAFLASNCEEIGQAVTSLGSTVAIKMLSDKPVSDPSRGIYSHRLGNRWLVGGASNVGCAILRKENFSDAELAELSAQIDPLEPVAEAYANYYPLLKAGERFPSNDPNKVPVLEPKPMLQTGREVDRKIYLQAILMSISKIEKDGYNALKLLGASPLTEVFTAGGGSKNPMWTQMREGLLGVPVRKANNVEALFGVAKLAKKFL